ncbi:MAG: aminopeptidase P N-terminal domain-containing protein, partial [Candidatus Cloacimonetes bacterium]|nr:aminopeptidase P N-terminal domain-containing protein [Candidatus Cloacimonadota bacterium]
MNKLFFKSNRENFSNLMKNNSMAIISAKKSQQGTLPADFVQKGNFFYLTGLKIPNSILLFSKNDKKTDELLFIERNIPEYEVWIGKKMSQKQASEISGIKRIYYLDEFSRYLHLIAIQSETCYYDYETSSIQFDISTELLKLSQIRQHYPTLKIEKSSTLLTKLRNKKHKSEIENIKKAISITRSGIMTILKKVKFGMYENELEAYFAFETIRLGAKQYAFSPIVASGKNATILHYEKNCSKIGKNDLIVLDVGA